jgi:hypothetical protein
MKHAMTDVVDLCASIENMIRTADPARRRAVARAFDGYAQSFPGKLPLGRERPSASAAALPHGRN